MLPQVLIYNATATIGRVLSAFLARHQVHAVYVSKPDETLSRLTPGQFSILLLDLNFGDERNPFDYLEAVFDRDPDIVVIAMPGRPQYETAMGMMEAGAFAFIPKPLNEHLIWVTVNKGLEHYRLRQVRRRMEEGLQVSRYGEFLGVSLAVRGAVETARAAAGVASPVLISGEPGVGKTHLAHLIHEWSGRRPVVRVRVSTVAPDRLEREFFGQVRTTTSKAVQFDPGLFYRAEGGTLIIDEVERLPLAFQGKLAQALEDGRVLPEGATQPYPIAVRVVGLTTADLREEVGAGRFREDLYFRLATVPIALPPLRERREDIALLLRQVMTQLGRTFEELSQELVTQLLVARWPGNVRQVESTLARMAALKPSGVLEVVDLPADFDEPVGVAPRVELRLTDASRRSAAIYTIQHALAQARGNRTRAAKLLGIPRHTLLYRMKKLGMR